MLNQFIYFFPGVATVMLGHACKMLTLILVEIRFHETCNWTQWYIYRIYKYEIMVPLCLYQYVLCIQGTLYPPPTITTTNHPLALRLRLQNNNGSLLKFSAYYITDLLSLLVIYMSKASLHQISTHLLKFICHFLFHMDNFIFYYGINKWFLKSNEISTKMRNKMHLNQLNFFQMSKTLKRMFVIGCTKDTIHT